MVHSRETDILNIGEMIGNAKRLIKEKGCKAEYADALYKYGRYADDHENDLELCLDAMSAARDCIEGYVKDKTGFGIWDVYDRMRKQDVYLDEANLYFDILLYEAQKKRFDSFMLYIEKDRERKDRFYLPRRKCLMKLGIVQALQDMLDDKLDILSISLPPGTGKTTLEKFFHAGVMGWYPKDFNLFCSHSADITRMYYDGVLSIVTDVEYLWRDVFPNLKVSSTNAKLGQINIGQYKPFQNLMTASVGSEMAGKVRAGKFLMVDDMIGKLEEALNINTLDKLWGVYAADFRQRKYDGCKELHIATRWSVHDIIGRLERVYEGNDRARFLAFPDIDPQTGESNFLYDINGLSAEFFHDQELVMDEVTYRCLYKNDPVEREGLLYNADELRYYVSLPLKEPDAVLAVCDTKEKGIDFMVLPVLYQYGNDYYLVDCICSDNSDYGIQTERVLNILMDYSVQQCEFESNLGGSRFAYEVEGKLNELGGRCNITTKPTETNKETRIIVNADWIKKNVLFKAKDLWGVKTDYSIFMFWLLSYSVAGKNKHDDVPDCMANFALFVANKYRVKQAAVLHNPFGR